MWTKMAIACAAGPTLLVSLLASPASAGTKVQVTCTDGTGYSVGAAATFGQNTANTAFNAVNPLGIKCSVSG